MRSGELLERFLALLDEAGVDRAAPRPQDAPLTWSAMRALAHEPVEDAAPRDIDGDGLLGQHGIYGAFMPGPFELDLTRQLTFYDSEGEYENMAQLNCTFRYERTRALEEAGTKTLWSFGMDIDEFFALALALRGFVVVEHEQLQPIALDVHYGDV